MEMSNLIRTARDQVADLYKDIYSFGKKNGCGYTSSEKMATTVTKIYADLLSNIVKITYDGGYIDPTETFEEFGVESESVIE